MNCPMTGYAANTENTLMDNFMASLMAISVSALNSAAVKSANIKTERGGCVAHNLGHLSDNFSNC
jgi:hypothetical protein